MSETDKLRKYLDAGMEFTELTRKRAESMVKDLVRAGEVGRNEAAARVEELLERSRASSESLLKVIRREIDERVAHLNLATRDEINALAARVGVSVPGARTPKPAPAKAAAKAPAATAPVAPRKPAATKAPATKAPATKATARKAPARKSPTAAPPAPTTPPAAEA